MPSNKAARLVATTNLCHYTRSTYLLSLEHTTKPCYRCTVSNGLQKVTLQMHIVSYVNTHNIITLYI